MKGYRNGVTMGVGLRSQSLFGYRAEGARMGVAVMFPGQGSQSPAMGASWRDTRGWAVVERAEEVLGEPVGELLLDEDPARLTHTKEAQLAVFLVSLAAWEATKDSV